MKYIILGKSGYIGSAFAELLATRKFLGGADYVGLSRSMVDYTDYDELDVWLDLTTQGKPATIINCAGYIGKPNVDACESNKTATIKGNVTFPAMIAQLCREKNIRLAHISSGCIYSGYDKKYTEDCPSDFDFQNGSFYSGTKDLAETQVKQINPDAHIFRLRIPFDSINNPRNYITKILSYNKLLDAENSLSHRGDFVRYCLDLLCKAPAGVYNVTNPGSLTTREVVDMLEFWFRKKFNQLGKEFHFFESTRAFSEITSAPRSNCVLATEKTQKFIKMRPVKDAMNDAISNYIIK